jgi:hypothetical protein
VRFVKNRKVGELKVVVRHGRHDARLLSLLELARFAESCGLLKELLLLMVLLKEKWTPLDLKPSDTGRRTTRTHSGHRRANCRDACEAERTS